MFWMIRKIMSILRGGATPSEVALAILLGTLLGFLPGFSLVSLALIGLILVVNVPIPLALLAVAAGKALSIVLESYTYGIGKAMLEVSAIESAVGYLVNAPYAAWMDLDRYCTLGGIPMGIVAGIVFGVAGASMIWRFRVKMAKLETGSARYQKWSKKWYVRFLTWLLFGSRKGAKGRSYSELLEVPTKPFRKWGLILVIIFVGGAVAGEFLLADLIANAALTAALEEANGATVDLDKVDVSIAGGRFAVSGLAVADFNDLSHNAFEAYLIKGDLDTKELASRRFVIDEVTIEDAKMNAKRDRKGERFREPPPEPEPDPDPEPKTEEGTSIYDVLEEAKVWRERLVKVKEWLEKMESEEKEEPELPPEEEAKRVGYRNLRASYLVRETPRFLVRSVRIKGLKPSRADVKQAYDVEIDNLSDRPQLTGPPTIRIHSPDKSLASELKLAFQDRKDSGETKPSAGEAVDRPQRLVGHLTFSAKDVDLSKLQKVLRNDNAVTLGGGRADIVVTDGILSTDLLLVPLVFKVRDLDAAADGKQKVFGLKAEHAKIAFGLLRNLDTQITLAGQPTAPRVLFDTGGLVNSLQNALMKNGREAIAQELAKRKAELVGKAQVELDKQLEKYSKKAPWLKGIGGKLPKVGEIDPSDPTAAIGGVKDAVKDAAKDAAKTEIQKQLDKQLDKVKDKIPGLDALRDKVPGLNKTTTDDPDKKESSTADQVKDAAKDAAKTEVQKQLDKQLDKVKDKVPGLDALRDKVPGLIKTTPDDPDKKEPGITDQAKDAAKDEVEEKTKDEVGKQIDKIKDKIPGLKDIDPAKLPGADRIPGLGGILDRKKSTPKDDKGDKKPDKDRKKPRFRLPF
jgi:uncharacterized protein (TIGR03546 family)